MSKKKSDSKTQTGFQQVGEFQHVFGHPIKSAPTPQSGAELSLRISLILEEVAEYTEAVGGMTKDSALQSNNVLARAARKIRGVIDLVKTAPENEFDNQNLVEMADALTDINYVVYGAGHVSGLPLDDCMREVHGSNMTKLDLGGMPIYNDDGKVMKGPDYTPPNLSKVLYPKGK